MTQAAQLYSFLFTCHPQRTMYDAKRSRRASSRTLLPHPASVPPYAPSLMHRSHACIISDPINSSRLCSDLDPPL